MRFALVICAAVLITRSLTAQSNAALRTASEARTSAVRAGNARDWANYTTNDFTLINPDGSVMSKQQRMKEIDGHPLPDRGAPTDVRWREYENAAVQMSQVTPGGKPARVTVVWVREGKKWKVMAAQFTPISTR